MLPKTKLKQLEKACNKLADVPAINYGGCGIAALALYRWCIVHKIQPDGFILLDDDGIDNNSYAIETGEYENMTVPSHIVLSVKGYYCDSRGISDDNPYSDEYDYVLDGIKPDALLYLINNGESWNDEFDRECGVPEIEQILHVDLSDIELNN